MNSDTVLSLHDYDGAVSFGPIAIDDAAEFVYVAADRREFRDPHAHVELMLYLSIDGGPWIPHGKCGANGGPAFMRDHVTPCYEFGFNASLPAGVNRRLKGLLVSMAPVRTQVVIATGGRDEITSLAGRLLE